MDEGKDKDVSVSRGSLEESTVTVSEHLAGESETRVESMVCEVQGAVGRVESCTEEGGSGGREDIMVEAMGSDVFVDGVSGNDRGIKVGSEENLNGEEIHDHGESGEAGLERDLRSSDGGEDVVGDLGSRGIGVSHGEASLKDGFESGSGGPVVEEKVAEGSVESKREVIEGEAVGNAVDEITSMEVEVANDEVQNTGIGMGVEGPTAVVGSTVGETQVVHMEDAVVVAQEEGLGRGLVEDHVERGCAGSEAQGNRAENGVGSSTVVSGTLDRETQVIVEEAVLENQSSLGKELDKDAEQGSDLNGGGDDVHQDVETQKLGVLDDEIWNPGIETAVAGSPAIVEDSSVQTQVVEEAAMVVNEEDMNSKNNTPGSQAIEGITSSSEEKQMPMVDTDTGGTGKDAIVNASPNSLDEQIPVAVRGEVAATDQGEYMCSTSEGMETDTFDENLSFSLEELQGNMETADGSTENHCNVCADSTLPCQPTLVVGGEDVAMAKKVHPDFEEAQPLKLEGCLDPGTAHDIAHVGLNTEEATEINEQVCNAQLDGMLSCSRNVQNCTDETLCTSTELDTKVTGKEDEISVRDNQVAVNSNVEVQGPAEKDQQVKLEERLDESGAFHLSQVDPNIGKRMAAQQRVNDVKPVSSDGGQELLVQKHLITVETIDASAENHRNICSDSISTGQPADDVAGGEVMAVDDKVPSNPSVEVPLSTDLGVTLSCSGNDQSLNPKVVCGNAEMDIQVMNEGEISLKDGEEVLDSNVEGLGPAEEEKFVAGDISEVDSTVGKEMQVEEQVFDAEQVILHGGREMDVEEPDSDTEQPKTTEEKCVKRTTVKAGNLVKSHQASYQLPLENESEFDVFDLVWGKVRSHPWWPGQIYDPSDASEKAMKYHKKDCFLVAYFGDRTFAWVDASQLKPFSSHFSQVEKQSNSEVFQNAVNCALEEVSRRVELELACSCIPKDAYDDIRLQIVENTGIRQESSMRVGVDKFASVQSFQPDKLVEYMKALAESPSSGADRLELVIAKAQLVSFYRLKGYYQLPEFQFCGGLVENGVDTFNFEDKMHATPFSKDYEDIRSGQEISGTQRSSYHKRKHNLKDSMYPRKKERSLYELMSGSMDSLDDDEFGSDGKATSKLVSPSSGKKRKVVDSTGDDSSQDARKTISLAKVSMTASQIPKPSFKIGECIRRVASQMTGSPSILKSNSERLQKLDGDGADVSFENFEDAEGKKMILPADYSSLDDLLSQLHLAARDPMKGYSFLNTVTSFFSDFRNSIIISRHSVDKAGGKRKKSSHLVIGSPETFEFEDMSDTYWTDRVIQNGAEEQPSGRNSRGYQIVPVELGKPVQKSRRSYSRKQYSDANHDLVPPKPPGYVDENSPAELIMNFPEMDCIPLETNLNKMFRRFGPLKESETEIDEETSRARVVFKRCSDAEVAYSSAPKFSIFGSMVVNYQLSYSVSVPFKTPPIVTNLGDEYAT